MINYTIIAIGTAIGNIAVALGTERFPKLKLGFWIDKNYFRIPYWLLALLVLVILEALGFYGNFTFGLLLGLVAQGLAQQNFYKIICKKEC